VNATTSTGEPLTDSDPSHYFGVDATIELKKFTNGEDADLPPGPSIEAGSNVTWTYVVTNTGNSTLTDILVEDDRLVNVTCPQEVLAPGEVMTCMATGIATTGQYSNTADVFAIPPVGAELVDEDPSHYFGETPTNLPEGEQPMAPADIFLPFLNREEDD
jgi:hypothetical protein